MHRGAGIEQHGFVAATASGTPPPEGPIRYGDLTDREFAAEKKKLGL